MVPGIDLAGTVVESDDPTIEKGEEVIITGYDLGVNHYVDLVSMPVLNQIGLLNVLKI